MASAKDTFEPHVFAAHTFAAGALRGVGVAPPAVSKNNLVGYYKCDEPGATDDFIDSHTGGRDLVASGSIGSVAGVINTARDFEQGTPNFAQRTDSAFSLGAGDMTVSCSVNLESLSGNGSFGMGIVGYMTGSAQAGNWWLGVETNGSVRFGRFLVNGSQVQRYETPAGVITTGGFHHILARVLGGVVTIWVDGVSQSLTPGSTSSGWANIGFNIGRMYTDATYHADGVIDEVAVFGRGVTDDEIIGLEELTPYEDFEEADEVDVFPAVFFGFNF